MLYVFHGTDTGKVHTKAHTLVEALKKKQPDAAYLEFDAKTLTPDALDAVIVGQGLFVQKYIVRLRDVSADEETYALIKERLKDIATSPHIFVLVEGALKAPVKKALTKYTEKEQEFSEKKKAEKGFQIFDLTKTIADRNPKRSWVKYQEALQNGMAPEEIHSMLFWQMKSIVGAGNASSAKEAGMKAFPFKKAQEALKRFGKGSAEQKMWELVDLYHEARRGKHDLGEEMERWILNISH